MSSAATQIRLTNIGLEEWMTRVAQRVCKARSDPNATNVHDVRVALRRCRTMSDALKEVTPNPAWRKIKRASRDLFRALGSLRDIQVQRIWVRTLLPSGDAFRLRFLRFLSQKEVPLREATLHALDEFDRKHWKKMSRKVEHKVQLFPAESVVFQRLASAQLDLVEAAFRAAQRSHGLAPWHRARIALKKFRYIVENFLPQRHEAWSSDMKLIQDLLGDIHDLDVLRSAARRFAKSGPDAAAILNRIAETRKEKLANLLPRISGPHSVLLRWRAGFREGRILVAATFPSQRRTA